MGIGARVERVDAVGGGRITEANLFKMMIIGRGQRAIAKNFDGIFNFGDFEERIGGFNSAKRMAYVVKSFYDALDSNVDVEVIARSFQAGDAVQATGQIDDTNGPAQKVYDIGAAFRGTDDKSVGGNDIARKIEVSENVSVALTTDSTASASTEFVVEAVDQFKVNDLFKVIDTGTPKTEYAFITAINTATKTITFAALSNVTAYEAATSNVFRQDVLMKTAVKNKDGVFIEKETFGPFAFAKNDTQGLSAAVNDVDTGSKFVDLVYNVSQTSPAATARPAADTAFVVLTGGSDGTSPVDADWNTLVANFNDVEAPMLQAPESESVTHHNNMSNFSTTKLRAIYAAVVPESANEATLKSQGTNVRGDIKFAYFPMDKWVSIDDPLNPGEKISIPSVGIAAAHYFNSLNRDGVKKNAAGNRFAVNTLAVLDESNDLIYNDSDGKGERLLKNHSINVSQFQKGKGILLNTARTVSTDDGYKQQNQLFGTWFLKNSIVDFLKTIEQDNAGQDLLDSARSTIDVFLRKQFRDGLFLTGKKDDGTPIQYSDVVILKADFTNNTLQDITDGKLTSFLQVVFAQPVEEAVLQLTSASPTTIL